MTPDPAALTPAHHAAVVEIVQQRAGDILRHAAARLDAEADQHQAIGGDPLQLAGWHQAADRLRTWAREN